ncbi:hypothetical protein GZ77_07490 [Endozoicomonas montiporae]|uniref:Pilus assembly protein TadG n=2 Tax=Endozoicomonas montiporae TaxID=1027273 RepID=A0A081N729_9GAMM|nr:tight adherence pilus pseudopilin TadF [Endozoicomonas montiporae]AMO55933.1 tight adherence protein F [Endozoicomonas montiporae CL-33]KEQ14252.1 hypothetical protein GZ77_07490 [Endozoicomonas montiporae]
MNLMVRRRFSGIGQRGVFTIEFALIASFIALVLVFISDMAARQTLQGHLQRLSYSGVNVIKERTQLYGSTSGLMTHKQASQLFEILKRSMSRTISGFQADKIGLHIEQVMFNDAGNCSGNQNDDACRLASFSLGGSGCRSVIPVQNRTELFLKTSWGNPISLYQVTLCYEAPNWYGNVIGDDFSKLQSTAFMMGR